MKYSLTIAILLLLIGTVSSTVMAEGNTITFDLPGFILGETPIGYNTAISDHQTINFGFTHYSSNVFYNIYNNKPGNESGYGIDLGITNYFHQGYEGLYWTYGISYLSIKNSSPNDQALNWLRGISYAIYSSLGYTKVFENGFTLGFGLRVGLDLNKDQCLHTKGFEYTTGYSW